MSVAKIESVKKTREERTCEKCRSTIAKGEPYLWFRIGFRSNHKHIRCTKSTCYPKPSERESRDRIASIMAEQEEFDPQSYDSLEGMEDAVHQLAETLREQAESYREASTDDYGNVFNPENEERADTLEASADDIESWTFDDEEPEDGTEAHDEWLEALREAAREAVDNIELP